MFLAYTLLYHAIIGFASGRGRGSDNVWGSHMNPGNEKKTVVIETTHNDYSGGGKYILQLAFALSNFCDVHLTNFNSDDPMLSGIGYRIKPYHNDFTPDLFIASSHAGLIDPKGKRNGYVCYFPRAAARERARQYDFVISICDFSDRHQKVVWGMPSYIINPYISMDKFYLAGKEDLIICVGNYFCEPDGHSKNQLMILNWFVSNRLYERYKLVFTGFIVRQTYYDHLLRKARAYPNIEVLTSVPFERLTELYSRARFLVHANGYQRKAPEQTEHYGYIAVEAMASGCQPIVHNSGGCSEFPGVRVWNNFNEIVPLLGPTDPRGLRELARSYSYDHVVEQQVKPFLEAVFL